MNSLTECEDFFSEISMFQDYIGSLAAVTRESVSEIKPIWASTRDLPEPSLHAYTKPVCMVK